MSIVAGVLVDLQQGVTFSADDPGMQFVAPHLMMNRGVTCDEQKTHCQQYRETRLPANIPGSNV